MRDILEQPGAGTTWPAEDTSSAAFAHIWQTRKVGSPVTLEAVSISMVDQVDCDLYLCSHWNDEGMVHRDDVLRERHLQQKHAEISFKHFPFASR